MGVRTRFLTGIAFVALAGVGPSAQETVRSAQTFRSGVDLITIDVTAVDGQGRPVADLKPADFVVKVDGKSRPVVSATLITVDRSDRSTASSDPREALVTTNVGASGPAPTGRRVAVVVDQTLIAPGSIQAVMRTAATFIDGLAPADYVAVLAIPEPGPRVDFTTDKARARAALGRIVGQPAKGVTNHFDMSEVEALQIDRTERSLANPMTGGTSQQIYRSLGPAMQRVLSRGWKELSLDDLLMDPSPIVDAIHDLQQESQVEAQIIKSDTTVAMRRLESYFKELSALDGAKSVVLVSAGLLLVDESGVESLARTAADARTMVNVVAVEHERERDHAGIGGVSNTGQDRALELGGLDTIADRTGGTRYNAIGPAEGIFQRLSLELSASYLVAVERRAADPDRSRIAVEVKRRGVTVRAPRSAVSAAANTRRSTEDVLRDALGSPVPSPGVPIRLSTFARRDAGGPRYVVNLAAQVGAAGTNPGFGVGYAVYDQQGQLIASRASTEPLRPARTNGPLEYDAAVTLPPGSYSVRLAAVDAEGHRGSVVRSIDLSTPLRDVLMASDLVVGSVAAEGGLMHPAVEPHVDGHLGAYLELYVPETDQGRVSVQLEVAEGDATPALATASLSMQANPQGSGRIAIGSIDLSLLPGRYLARATVRREGAVVKTMSRPFVLERATAGPAAPARATATALAPDVRARTAGYVHAFVQGLSNVVGQEDFEMSGKHVTSDFLLVQYPGAAGDFLAYRDVMQVNGTPLPNREERLADLFLKPSALVRDRVRQITLASEQQVPSLLNPIFVLAFLQADFQSHFELTVNEAGREWPVGVKAVSFIETARPTILRGGLTGDLDVPVKGIAWLEPETGRVLQTELQIPNGRGNTTVTTKFRLDARLQIMVPEQMRTENPNGAATYSNFRRFSVATDTAVADPQ